MHVFQSVLCGGLSSPCLFREYIQSVDNTVIQRSLFTFSGPSTYWKWTSRAQSGRSSEIYWILEFWGKHVTKSGKNDQEKIERVTESKHLGQTTHLKDTTKEETYARIRAAWSCLWKKIKKIFQDGQLPISLKKKKQQQKKKKQQQQIMDQCVLPTMTCGCQTWSINKQMTNKLRTAQRAMERKTLGLKLQNKIPCSEIRKKTKIIDIIE